MSLNKKDVVKDILEPELLRFQNLQKSDEPAEAVLLIELDEEARESLIETVTMLIGQLTYPNAPLAINAALLMGIALGRRVESYSRENPHALLD